MHITPILQMRTHKLRELKFSRLHNKYQYQYLIPKTQVLSLHHAENKME